MGLVWFTLKVVLIFAIVLAVMSFAWPQLEPILPGVKSTVTGMFSLVESIK